MTAFDDLTWHEAMRQGHTALIESAHLYDAPEPIRIGNQHLLAVPPDLATRPPGCAGTNIAIAPLGGML